MKHYKNLITVSLTAALVLCMMTGCGKNNTTKLPQPSASAEPQRVVTGSGVLEADSQLTVCAKVAGDITSANFEEGQTVSAGDVLYEIDKTIILSNIKKGELALNKAQLAFKQTEKEVAKLNIHAGTSGTLTSVYVKHGDNVMAGAKVADIVNDETMLLKIPFITDTVGEIYEGQSAEVLIIGSFSPLSGTVRKVTSGHMTSAEGSVVTIVEINVPNPGAVKKGDKGTAVIGGVACSDAGDFDYSESETVIAETAGKVGSLNVSAGDHVSAGTVIASLTSDTLNSQHEQNALNIKDASLSLENLNTQLKDYTIRSSINGVVVKKTVDSNDTLSAANMANLATIADLSKIIFKINVDELDIADVCVGQQVTFKVDAMPDREFTGTVEYVPAAGAQVSGVGLYEVKVAVDGAEGLLPGMTVNAEIHV